MTFKKIITQILKLDFRFEISTKQYIRNTLHPDVVHFSKFNIAKEQCGVTEQAKNK